MGFVNEKMGFSDKAADSMAKMTELTLEKLATSENPLRGETTLDQYIANLVSQENKKS